MMEAKVHELGKLVMELGLMQKPATARRQDVGVRREPSVGWGRGAGDAGDGMDGRLPTIREDKYYPRRTMEYEKAILSFKEDMLTPLKYAGATSNQ